MEAAAADSEILVIPPRSGAFPSWALSPTADDINECCDAERVPVDAEDGLDTPALVPLPSALDLSVETVLVWISTLVFVIEMPDDGLVSDREARLSDRSTFRARRGEDDVEIVLNFWSRDPLDVVRWTANDVSFSEELRLTWMNVGDMVPPCLFAGAPFPAEEERRLSFRKKDLPSICHRKKQTEKITTENDTKKNQVFTDLLKSLSKTSKVKFSRNNWVIKKWSPNL